MSSTSTDPIPGSPPAPNRRTSTILLGAAITLALILGSGVARTIQARGIERYMASGAKAPFELNDLPMKLGTWLGEATELDPRVVQATGSTSLITRHYVDQTTGVGLDAIVLYGPTSDIFIHTPEVCYPSAGYTQTAETLERKVDDFPFRSIQYSKGATGRIEIQEVYYAWRLNGEWSPYNKGPKAAQRIPGMYKIQISRLVKPGESRIVDNPCESLLRSLVPALEAKIAAAESTTKLARSSD